MSGEVIKLDEADRHKAGKLPTDPAADTKTISAQVPIVRTYRDIFTTSRKRAFEPRTQSLITTGHWRLDQITGGFRPGFVWLLGADTSFGKTSWLVSVADENIKRGKRVLIVSTEDPEELYGDRFMVRRARVNAMRYRDGRLEKHEQDAVLKAENEALPEPVYVDASASKFEDLAPHLMKIIKECDIDLIAFDYIQEAQSKRRFQDERVKFKEIAKICRNVAKLSKISGLILSQLTLSQDGKTKIPTRHNIRECRDIANASEVILIGFEPDQDIETKKSTILAGTKCLLADKVKNGPRGGKVPLDWDNKSACFNLVLGPGQKVIDDIADQFDDFADEKVERCP